MCWQTVASIMCFSKLSHSSPLFLSLLPNISGALTNHRHNKPRSAAYSPPVPRTTPTSSSHQTTTSPLAVHGTSPLPPNTPLADQTKPPKQPTHQGTIHTYPYPYWYLFSSYTQCFTVQLVFFWQRKLKRWERERMVEEHSSGMVWGLS